VLVLTSGLLVGCSDIEPVAEYPERRAGQNEPTYGKQPSIFGPEGLKIFGSDDEKEKSGGVGIGVNSFLWRAALDTVSFMPITDADPFGGTILSDWYMPNQNKNERIKTNIFILSKELRADGLRVSVFRQKQQNGAWKDAPVDPKTATAIENTILTRARQLRVASQNQGE
jgi:hypothetical protein